MTGPSITSFRQEMENLTMTSTICNLCAGPVMAGSKTGYCNGSHGATLALARGRAKTVGGNNSSEVEPKVTKQRSKRNKGKHKRRTIKYGWRAELLWLRLTWRTHWHPSLTQTLKKLKIKK